MTKQVALSEWMYPRWWEIAYLIDPDSWRHFAQEIERGPDKKFDDTVEALTQAYIVDGVLPPEPIASAILNIADDLKHGRRPTIRLGDYIVIQNYVRK